MKSNNISLVILLIGCFHFIESNRKIKNLNHAYELIQEHGMEECESKYKSELCLLATRIHLDHAPKKQEFTSQLSIKQSKIWIF
jgi:hypothetical protein